MESDRVSPSDTEGLHSAYCPWYLSICCMHQSLVPLCGCVIFQASVCQNLFKYSVTKQRSVSSIFLGWIELLWISVHTVLQEHMFSFLRDKCPGLHFLGGMAATCLLFKEAADLCSWVAVPSYVPTGNGWQLVSPPPLQHLEVSRFLF